MAGWKCAHAGFECVNQGFKCPTNKIKHVHEQVCSIMILNVLGHPLIHSLRWQEEPLQQPSHFPPAGVFLHVQLLAQTTPSLVASYKEFLTSSLNSVT